MDRRILVGALVLVIGCETDPGKDAPVQQEQPSFIISDGANSGGNPEFFFLPPLVPPPSRNPNWNVGGFNRTLQPTMAICALDLSTTAVEADVLATTPCRPNGYAIVIPFAATGTTDKVRFHLPMSGDPGDVGEDGPSEVNGGHYHTKWRVPKSSDVYFRLKVIVGTKQLGFADLRSVAGGADIRNVNTGQSVVRKDGESIEIKFRIENRALCDNPGGTGPCSSTSVNLGSGGTLQVVTDPLLAPSGVVIPPQPNQAQTVVATVQPCADFNPRVTDLPTFGSCLRITLDPALTQALAEPATVFVCDYPPDVSSLLYDQGERVTLHRLLTTGAVEAVPHAEADCTPPAVAFSTRAKGMLRYLAAGRYRAAGDQLIGLIGPTPLLALDRGGGGLVRGFSDFQFALPAKMTIAAGNGQTAAPGLLPVNPTVLVTDLGGDPVKNARVTFAGTGTVGSSPVLTDAAGLAQVTWSVVAGANTLTASGRGIAGADNNGPRPGIDPFMSIQDPFDPGVLAPWSPVTLLTGSQSFTATGVTAAPLPFGNLGANYYYKVVAFDAEPNFAVGPLGSGFALGNGGFGTTDLGCPLNVSNVATNWPVNTDILVRKQIIVPSSATKIKISIAIDNDVRLYLDGVEITGSAVGAPEVLPPGGYLIHEGCATNDSFIFNRTVTPGVHEIAIRGRDRGGLTYLDARIEVVAAP